MNVVEFLASLAKQDIRLWLEGENLRFSAPEGAFTPEIKAQVLAHKPAIIEFLRQARKLNEDAIEPVSREQPLVTSFGQQRLWILHQLNPRDVTYNMSSALRIRGPLDGTLLEKVLVALVRRHESLRTCFQDNDGEPLQVVQNADQWRLQQWDLSSLPASEQETQVTQAVNEEALTPYDLSTGPLFRAQLARLAVDHHVLIAGMHHIISDAWSMEVLVKELSVLYLSYSAGMGSPLPPLPIQYADYAAWQRRQMAGEGLRKQLEYWQQTLAQAPQVLALPTDRPRPALPTSNGALKRRQLPAALAHRINQACSRLDVTPFMFFLGAWQLLLGRYAVTSDVVVGSPIAGRSRSEIQELIGFFVNLLLMRLDTAGNPDIATFYRRVREMALGAFSHQDLPIDRLMESMDIERQAGYPPLAQAAFQLINMQDGDAANPFADAPLQIEPIPAAHVAARMDVLLGVAKTGDQYQASVEYNTDLFDDSTIGGMLDQYLYLLDALCGAETQRIDEIELYDQEHLLNQLGFAPEQYELLPLNPNQRSMVLDQLARPETLQNAYGIYVDLPVNPEFDRLQQALDALLAATPILRMQLVQCHLPAADPAYGVIPPRADATLELIDLNTSHWQSLSVHAAAMKLMHRPYDLFHEPLLHFYLLQKDGHYRLVVACHHIVLDGASTYLLMERWLRLYNGLASGESPAVETDRGAFAYQRWSPNRVDAPTVLDYWRDQARQLEPLDFPFSPAYRQRAEESPFEDRIETLSLDHRQMDTIREFCIAQGINPPLYFKTLFALMLQHYCRPETGFSFAEFYACRDTGWQDALGCFYQQFPAVVPGELLEADVPLQEWFARLKVSRDSARDHRLVSLQAQQSILPRGRTVFMFNYYNFVSQASLAGEPVQPVMSAPKVEGGVQLIVKELSAGLELELRYDARVFNSLQFLPRLMHLNEQIQFGEPEFPRQLNFLSAAEQMWLSREQSQRPLDAVENLVAGFERSVERYPQRAAVLTPNGEWSYAELNLQANRVAHWLLANGVSANTRVGVCLERSAELLVAIWGVLKAGGAYVPLDPAYPQQRLQFMLADADAPVVITRTRHQPLLAATEARVLCLDGDPQLASQPTTNPALAIDPQQLLYVIYTSGSTGQPKGAQVRHQGAINLQHWYLDLLGLTPDDRTLLVSAVGFDLTQKNLFAPLLVGASIVMPAMELYDEQELLTLAEQHSVSWINCAPSAFYPLVELAAMNGYKALRTLRYLVLGGEPIRLAPLYPWLTSPHAQAQLVNSYGPTECTDVVAWHLQRVIEHDHHSIPIGKPIPNMQLHLLNDHLQPVAPGCVGEICVTGIGVGPGYINRDELTCSLFVETDLASGPLYRTGDLGRYLPSGEIEYIGRRDFQVKVRGLRIELGEIETALKALPGVEDALVLVHEERLLGYIIASVDPEDWRPRLRDQVPEYMIPSLLIALPRWPLTPNGKVDRKALPDPEAALAETQQYVAPRSSLEQQLAAVWEEVLQRRPIGILDNLFDVGGNSLLATRIVSRIKQQFEIPLTVRELFTAPTIVELAQTVARAGQTRGLPPIEPLPETAPKPLSYAQQRLWFLDQLEPGSTAYNMPGAFHLRGRIDVDALGGALATIVDRHAVLRTRFSHDQDEPLQIIDPAGQWRLAMTDLSHEEPALRQARARQAADALYSHVFDLQAGQLFYARLLVLDEQEFVLLINMHHSVSDGWSNGILLRELALLYDAYSHGRSSPLPDLPIQYSDFAHWQRQWLSGDELERQIGYWRQALAGVQVLNLPPNYPRRTDTGFAGNVLSFSLSRGLTAKLNQLCREQGVSLYMLTLSAYIVLLSKYSGQQDISVGSPIANRNFAELEPLIGFFVNTLVLRAELEPEASFTELLAQIRQQTLDAYAHQDVPFERLVDELVTERDMLHSPLFQVLFSLQNIELNTAGIPGIELERMENREVVAKFDLEFSLMEQDQAIKGEVVYRTGLFEKDFVAQLMGHYVQVLQQVAAAPQSALADISLLSATEAQALHQWNDTTRDFDRQLRVQQLIERQVDATPAAPALIQGEQLLTYAELDQKANQLTRYLLQNGVQADAVVAVMMPRSIELMVSILAVMKAGATYLPLDPAYPAERIEYMLQDSGACLLLVDQASTAEALTSAVPAIALDQVAAELTAMDAGRLPPQGSAETLLYVIYTSGSTGTPKGTGARHRAEVNLLNWYCREFAMDANDRVLLISAIGFDLTQKNLFAPLAAGGALVLPRHHQYDPQQLVAEVAEHRVTWINCAPNAFYPLLQEDESLRQLSSLRWVFLGGEPIDLDRVADWLKRGNGQLVNSYGPTECADIATAHVVRDLDRYGSGPIPIGRAIDNVKLYIVDERLRMVPQGVPGELCIGGEGVGPGYFNHPEQTAERFVADPFGPGGTTLYRTGDLARYLPDGEVEYLGRMDNQVKIRGLRIEPGEIEALLRQLAGVSASCVVVRDDVSGQQQLVAYLVADDEYSLSQVRDHLRARLPDFMLPAAVVMLEQMPLTPNGKVAKNQLPAPDWQRNASGERVPPATATEQQVLAIWEQTLQRQGISVEDDFFAVGGQSLLATQVISRIRKEFQINLPLRALFESPTIRYTAAQIDQAKASAAVALPPVQVVDRDQPLPLSFVQQQLWLLDQLDPGTPAYNMPVALRIHGPLDVAAFSASFNQVIQRHETLRSNFTTANGEPVVIIHPRRELVLEQVDLCQLDPVAQDRRLDQLMQQQADTGFDLQTDLLLRGTLVKLRDTEAVQEHAFIGAMHHIVSDGWSLNVMTAELMACYQSHLTQQPARLPTLDIQYVDVAAWQRQWLRGEVLAEHLEYWRGQLDNEGRVLQLQPDRPRPRVMTSHGRAVHQRIDRNTAEAARKLAREEGATLFMVLVAAYQLLFHKYTGQNRINVGTPIAGRDSVETEQLIGFFINTVVLSSELHAELNGRELLRQVRDVTLGAYSHQALPFEKLVEELRPPRDSSRTPFFQVFLNLLNLPPQDEGDAPLTIEPLTREDNLSHAKYDFNLYVSEEPDSELELVLVYNSDLYRDTTAQRLLADFAWLLESLCGDAGRSLPEYRLLREPEPEWLPDLTRAPQVGSYPSPVDGFLHQAASSPQALALTWAEGTLTYGELARRSEAVARGLAGHGYPPELVVAVVAHRSPDLIVSLLGILRAGLAFSILDAGYPVARLQAMVATAEPVLILDTGGGDPEALAAALQCPVMALAEVESAASAADPWSEAHDPSSAAYVAFTSGSTGRPKGIRADFRPLAHFVHWYQQAFQISAEDRFTLLSGLSHDPLLRDIFVPLACGGTVCIPAPDWMLNPDGLVQWLAQENVSISHLTPALAQLILDAAGEKEQLVNLRLLGVGGDRLAAPLVHRIRQLAPQSTIAGFYGATETPQVMAAYALPPALEDTPEADLPPYLPLGKGIDGVELLVLDPQGQLCAPGQVGEIVIRTPYLSLGYIEPEANSPFTLNTLSGSDQDRLYHSGDQGRYTDNGAVEFLGRLDQQIKIRGFRVEPAEVEASIEALLPGQGRAVVCAATDPRGDDCLVAYLYGVDGQPQDSLRHELRTRLPEYMVPALFIAIEELPLNRNGKVDRTRLPDPARFWSAREFVAPATPIEEEIAAIWQQVLKLKQISVVDNFFDVGGHSLLAVQIVTRVKEKYQVEFSMRRLLEIATIQGMANYVENALWVRQSGAQPDADDDEFEELEI